MSLRTVFAASLLAATSSLAWAQVPVHVDAPWARATVAGQQAAGAFMRITAQEPLQLVGVSSPVSAHSEVHEMKMEGDVMRMRAMKALDLPAGQTVELDPAKFEKKLEKQRAELIEKYKARDVVFSVAVQDGKVSLKAKIVKKGTKGEE